MLGIGCEEAGKVGARGDGGAEASCELLARCVTAQVVVPAPGGRRPTDDAESRRGRLDGQRSAGELVAVELNGVGSELAQRSCESPEVVRAEGRDDLDARRLVVDAAKNRASAPTRM